MTNEVTFRPATANDAFSFYGERPAYSFKGFVAEKCGELLGIAGIYFSNGIPVAFSDMREALKKHRKAIVMAGRKLVRQIDELPYPVYAIPSPDEPNSENFLRRLGFEPEGELLVRRK